MGFLLLTSQLGDPKRKPLTVAQFRDLSVNASHMEVDFPDRELNEKDLFKLGYNREMAARILYLLEGQELLKQYIKQGAKKHCFPLTRISSGYPQTLHSRLGLEAPNLWFMGDVTLLDAPAISLVGSRDLREENREFAREVGRQAALQGYTLISGNARGADRETQDSCLINGGKVISVVADGLSAQKPEKNILYLSEDGYDLSFSAVRALSRNRVIHALPTFGTFVAQCSLKTGGTWSGTEKNLKKGWSSVFCFDDGSAAQSELCARGAKTVTFGDLKDFYTLHTKSPSLF
jgi:predicted Rossmann fold nucleotide-binding protein DprA/Smf involved in DNA uptake